MVNVSETRSAAAATAPVKLQRLHHFAYTTYDMEATRHFYEDLIGMPLAQTWVEAPAGSGRRYVHCFFGLADGGAIAYFEHDGATAPEDRPASEGHIAFKTDAEAQAGIRDRLRQAGYGDDEVRLTDHGYCVSLYATDPNGLKLEFTVDHPEIDQIAAYQGRVARDELRRWQSGDRSPNNSWRPSDH